MKPFYVLLFFVTACYILSASETVDIKSLQKQLKSKDEAVAYHATAQLAAYYTPAQLLGECREVTLYIEGVSFFRNAG